jgi:hypothetical protein
MHSRCFGILETGLEILHLIWYSLSSERLVGIKITKFYMEKVVKFEIYPSSSNIFCPEITLELMYFSSAFCSVGLQAYNLPISRWTKYSKAIC